MKKWFGWCLGIVCAQSLMAQSFSGTLEFRYATQKDTSMNVYIVKEPMVRLDQYSKKGGNIEGSFLFDLKKNEIRFLNPKRKIYGFQKNETPQVIKGTCEVTKTNNTKKIAGYKCTEYVVKNTEENTVISYWITEAKFTFFLPMIKLWNRKDKQSIYFEQIKNLPAGAIPIMSEERQISDGKALTKLEFVKIIDTPPADDKFAIPAGYTKFEQ